MEHILLVGSGWVIAAALAALVIGAVLAAVADRDTWSWTRECNTCWFEDWYGDAYEGGWDEDLVIDLTLPRSHVTVVSRPYDWTMESA